MNSISTPASTSSPVSISSGWPICRPARCQASRPVDMFGPVPKRVLWPKEQSPEGARYCEEVDAFVPVDASYRIRGIEREKQRQPLAKRLLNRHAKVEEGLVMAMGVTHGKLDLIPLGEARQRADIVYRSVESLNDGAPFGCGFRTDLISLGEARRRPEIVYRAVV